MPRQNVIIIFLTWTSVKTKVMIKRWTKVSLYYYDCSLLKLWSHFVNVYSGDEQLSNFYVDLEKKYKIKVKKCHRVQLNYIPSIYDKN